MPGTRSENSGYPAREKDKKRPIEGDGQRLHTAIYIHGMIDLIRDGEAKVLYQIE
jgi:hypothetical protein